MVWTSIENMYLAKSQHSLESITLYMHHIFKAVFFVEEQQNKKPSTIENVSFALGIEFQETTVHAML